MWVDPNSDHRYLSLKLRVDSKKKKYGSILKTIQKLSSSSPKPSSIEKNEKLRLELYSKLNWTVFKEEYKWNLIRNPPDFSPF